ncbi:hypothetical protein NP493_93g03010 [Ridgeia piscesae]|uniref:G-protein coupled receptors family 1 profile domain-containing protein n=1 Tax=Ridgeia piscesae TaxID=27915 RepID=A0AAD9P840_RIDPI|nr:hypothetical protein NP493_93g03010 [Ridgeia piscesae]
MELAKYNIVIAALCETRFSESGSLNKLEYSFFWSGKPEGERNEAGVGFAVKKDIVKNLTEMPRPGDMAFVLLKCLLSIYLITPHQTSFVASQTPSDDDPWSGNDGDEAYDAEDIENMRESTNRNGTRRHPIPFDDFMTSVFAVAIGYAQWYFTLVFTDTIPYGFVSPQERAAIVLNTCNVVANPFVYGFMLPAFRRSLKKTFGCVFVWQKYDVNSSTTVEMTSQTSCDTGSDSGSSTKDVSVNMNVTNI